MKGDENLEIVKNVHLIEKKGVHASNAYLICEDDPILVDTCMPGDEKWILDGISELGLKPGDISTIVATHFHIDHTGGLFELKERTNAKVVVHPDDMGFVSGKMDFPFLLRVVAMPYGFKHVQADAVCENDMIGNFIVIHTPGHTPGSISLYNSDKKIIIVGDVLRSPDRKIKGPSRLFTMDKKQAKESVKKISQLDFEVILAGHGEPIKSNGVKMLRDFSHRK